MKYYPFTQLSFHSIVEENSNVGKSSPVNSSTILNPYLLASVLLVEQQLIIKAQSGSRLKKK